MTLHIKIIPDDTGERYRLIYKFKGELPRTGKILFRSHKRAMQDVKRALKDCESVTLCTLERTETGYSLIDTKDF